MEDLYKIPWLELIKNIPLHIDKIINEFKDIDVKDIKLIYDSNNLLKLIENENDSRIKFSLIISYLHQIIYDNIIKDAELTFASNKEMPIIKLNLTYYVIRALNNNDNLKFNAFIIIYAFESLYNNNFYIGIDLEYRDKKAQLIQINFEHPIDKRSIIYLISPEFIDKKIFDNFIFFILTNRKIKKILHGADSQDIPYIYETILNNDKNKIIKFTNSFIDTKILCEYYNFSISEIEPGKCSIYDTVYDIGLITKEKHNELINLVDSIPHIYDIGWNINKLSKLQILYAQYDVMFLKYYYFRIMYIAMMKFNNINEQKNVLVIYKKLLYELTQFIFLEKRNITAYLEKANEETRDINNYMIKSSGKVYKLIDIFNNVSINIIINNPIVNISSLLGVKFFRKQIIILVKFLVYHTITYDYIIFKNKTEIWTHKVSDRFLFDHFKKYPYLLHMCQDIEYIVRLRIKEFIS